ncbi:MAG: molybdopterin converting factor subunit 1 [Caldilineaceae bacterium]|jgi:molybdopterin converting factor subunit 1|nr:molybdopterin converting factor subunit 1 [Caldilineaceae bacterium]
MIQIHVRLFATLRQLAGWSQQPLELPEGATLDEALAAIDQRFPALTIGRRTFYAAVNQEYAKGDQVLHNGDEVALFPPVSGGSTAWAHAGVQEQFRNACQGES